MIVILHTENRARESEYLTEGHKHRVVDFAGRRHDKACNKQSAAYGD